MLRLEAEPVVAPVGAPTPADRRAVEGVTREELRILNVQDLLGHN